MPEHQQIQQSKKPDTIFQKQVTTPKQIPLSNPMAIIQRAKINPKSLTHADVMQLQRTIGNRAVGKLLSEIGMIPSTAKPVQRQEIPEKEETCPSCVQRQEIPEEEEPLQGKMTKTIQRQEIPEEDEPLQGKMIGAIQRQEIPEEEDPLQGKMADTIQRQEIPEEEDTLQGKMMETIQRQEIPEEEEPLQGKLIETIQRQEIPEEEEPLQGKMIETIQRQEIPEEEEPLIPEEEEPLQIKKENNTGMPDNLRAGVESLSGIDMNDVRVHYNSDKPAEVGALAYTQGTNIHVAPGQEKYLSHEAWHVVQQAQGRVQATTQMKGLGINDDPSLEHEADIMGSKTAQFVPTPYNEMLQGKFGREVAQKTENAPNNNGMPDYFEAEIENIHQLPPSIIQLRNPVISVVQRFKSYEELTTKLTGFQKKDDEMELQEGRNATVVGSGDFKVVVRPKDEMDKVLLLFSPEKGDLDSYLRYAGSECEKEVDKVEEFQQAGFTCETEEVCMDKVKVDKENKPIPALKSRYLSSDDKYEEYLVSGPVNGTQLQKQKWKGMLRQLLEMNYTCIEEGRPKDGVIDIQGFSNQVTGEAVLIDITRAQGENIDDEFALQILTDYNLLIVKAIQNLEKVPEDEDASVAPQPTTSSKKRQDAQLVGGAEMKKKIRHLDPQKKTIQKKKENNTGIPDNLKTGVESISGIYMSNVRVHYNSDKPAEIGALAYTKGTDIHVAPGQERHLPHEAWYTTMQPRSDSRIFQRKEDGESSTRILRIPTFSGVGLPLQSAVRAKMEGAFSADFSSVHIHEGEQAEAIGAAAYTQGENIHFAPGRYDPASASGQSLLGHELTHVVQQRLARVSSPQGKGVPINTDPALESEADRLGVLAARGENVHVTGAREGKQYHTMPVEKAPIQGNFGVEIEIGGGDEWRVTYTGTNDRVHKGESIVQGEGFQLQAEESGKESTIEFVADPPGMRDEKEFNLVLDGMVRLGLMMQKLNNTKSFPATKIGGSSTHTIKPGFNFTGSMQATVGIPLACIPALYKQLTEIGCEGGEEYLRAVESARESEGLMKSHGFNPSMELQGLLTLLKHYFIQGDIEKERSFPKSVFKVMARTDFKSMFDLLPKEEKESLARIIEPWTRDVLVNLKPEKPVLGQTFNYDETKQKPSFKINTSRKDWLLNMPVKDRLSKGGMQPGDVSKASKPEAASDPIPQEEVDELYLGMGAYGSKTDAVRYEGDKQDTQAVLLEIRNPPNAGVPNNWKQAARVIFDAMNFAIKHPHGLANEGVERKFESRETTSQRDKRKEKEFLASVDKKIKDIKAHKATGRFEFRELLRTPSLQSTQEQNAIDEVEVVEVQAKIAHVHNWGGLQERSWNAGDIVEVGEMDIRDRSSGEEKIIHNGRVQFLENHIGGSEIHKSDFKYVLQGG